MLPEGDYSSTVVGGMAHNGSPSLHAILKELPSEDGSTSSEGESSGSLIPMMCNVVTSATPIATTPLPKETPVHQTIPAALRKVTIPRSDTRPLPEQPTFARSSGDVPCRTTSNVKPRSDKASMPTSGRSLRPDWPTYTNASRCWKQARP
jgi:hypothetical protein